MASLINTYVKEKIITRRRQRVKERMKLVWSPERASKAYIDTVKSCEIHGEAGVAELVSAMAAGWNAQFIVETWSKGGSMNTSIGLAVACNHTAGRHLCIVPDEESCSEYIEAMNNLSFSPEVMVGGPEKVLEGVNGIEFLVVDGRRKDFDSFIGPANLNSTGSVLVCKNAGSRPVGSRWRTVSNGGSRRVVRSVFLPVGTGLDIAHVAGDLRSGKRERRWFKHFDHRSGEEYVIRK